MPKSPAEVAALIVEELGGVKSFGGRGVEKKVVQVTGILRENSAPIAKAEVSSSTAALSTTPRAEWTREEWIRLLTPWAQSVREQVFEGSDPPFNREEAAAWIEAEARREHEEFAEARAAVLKSPECRERLERVQEDAEWLATRAGLLLSLDTLSPPGLFYPSADGGRISSVPTSRGGRLLPLARAAESMAMLAGFEPHEVTVFLLTGTHPLLPRTRTRAYFNLGDGPDGKVWRAPRVSVDFHTADIRHEDLRNLHGEIQEAWEALRATAPGHARDRARQGAARRGREKDVEAGRPASARRRPRRSRIAREDIALYKIIESMGGPPTRGSHKTWKEVHDRWEAAGHKPTSPEALRKRWSRLPSDMQDSVLDDEPTTKEE